ncbi:MAG: acyl-ACP--UDP-N-acetylglucosamine O-acyltransferase [Lentisphaerae bacterium]|nr:acyl-ACP--UDP-N-acetylglucosamine O-acyltransferase [Lentisphaerota bacterium]
MIHGTAVIDKAAEIGPDVRIGPYCVVEADVRIGAGCELGPHVSLRRYTSLGPRCRVHAGAVLGDEPQDTAFSPCRSEVRIGADCIIREGVTVHRGTKPDTATVIGDGCFLMGFSHCAHNVVLGRQVILANGALLAGYVEVGDRAFISGNCVVHQFVKIGRLTMLGGGCAVSKDVPPYCTMRPVSLNAVQGLNVVGMRRAGLSSEERREIREAYGLLYRSGLAPAEAAARIRERFATGPALEFPAFMERSSRGLCPASGRGAARDEE